MKNEENISLWKRIVDFIKSLFAPNDILSIESPKEEYVARENTVEELSNQYEIMSLQKDYEKGIVKLEDLSECEKSSLMELYKKQVETLEINVDIKKKELLSYKKKILKAKQESSLKFNK